MPLGAATRAAVQAKLPLIEAQLNIIDQAKQFLYRFIEGDDQYFTSTADCNAAAVAVQARVNAAAAAIVTLTT